MNLNAKKQKNTFSNLEAAFTQTWLLLKIYRKLCKWKIIWNQTKIMSCY